MTRPGRNADGRTWAAFYGNEKARLPGREAGCCLFAQRQFPEAPERRPDDAQLAIRVTKSNTLVEVTVVLPDTPTRPTYTLLSKGV